jgi:hypothetical protein
MILDQQRSVLAKIRPERIQCPGAVHFRSHSPIHPPVASASIQELL